MRINQTDTERFLWARLRDRRLRGYKFRRQQIIGPYVVDFVCLTHRLIIELDGGQHMEHAAYDSARTAFLESEGFRVLRVWTNEVRSNVEGVLDFILGALRAPPSPQPPQPSPARGEETPGASRRICILPSAAV